ncbi:unnamed protein product [Chrysodeixis includens]|uniref:Uncharacterized protein n=1 Tax=Chrysodeixis includens TaxID=689277 RepID=A0A9P0C1R9_CHRIL|nr:unnamed protein product [Chrysodeixis includens]
MIRPQKLRTSLPLCVPRNKKALYSLQISTNFDLDSSYIDSSKNAIPAATFVAQCGVRARITRTFPEVRAQRRELNTDTRVLCMWGVKPGWEKMQTKNINLNQEQRNKDNSDIQKMGRQEPQGLSIEGSVHDQAVYLNQVTAPAIGSTYFGLLNQPSGQGSPTQCDTVSAHELAPSSRHRQTYRA